MWEQTRVWFALGSIKEAGEREKHNNFHFREMLIMVFWTGAG